MDSLQVIEAGNVWDESIDADFTVTQDTVDLLFERVATKFVNVARRYYAEQGIQAEVIKLYGAMELAPLMNLADEIVDIVDTGNTLRANGMSPRELIAPISTRLVVNKAAMTMKHERLKPLLARLSQAVERRRPAAELPAG